VQPSGRRRMRGTVLSGTAMEELLILVCNHVLGGLGRVESSRNACHLAQLLTRKERRREGPPQAWIARPATRASAHALHSPYLGV
jgi:hypothetical protein